MVYDIDEACEDAGVGERARRGDGWATARQLRFVFHVSPHDACG